MQRCFLVCLIRKYSSILIPALVDAQVRVPDLSYVLNHKPPEEVLYFPD